jgi:hypothetical protein
MLKKLWTWLKSLVISTKAPIKRKPDGGGGSGEEGH